MSASRSGNLSRGACSAAAFRAAAVAVFLVFLVPAVPATAAVSPKPDYFAAARSIELLGEVYQEVAGNYVDSLDVSELMYAAIDGMLAELDPYTSFLDEAQSEELDELTAGKYAGIGVTIGFLSGEVYILSVIEGFAASQAGLRVGDRIHAVEGVPVGNRSLDEIRTRIKGASGTTVRLGIQRDGSSTIRDYTLRREEVRVSTVTYAGLFDGFGYVEMNSFGQHSADELAAAIKTVQSEAAAGRKPLKGIILDLRGNPGGLLNAAVDVTGLFVAKGSRVVSTRGRELDSEEIYITKNPPLVAALPLAVLINGESASASEIVAAAIQEHDRGVILGEGSFGKGLVQSVFTLPYDHSLKLTTAKYYTPSGRLIQKPLERKEGNRKVIGEAAGRDSAKAFFTVNRRKVYSGGGIRPDIAVSGPRLSDYEQTLRQKGMFFRFASRYRSAHPAFSGQESGLPSLLGEFNAFLESEKFSYRSQPQRELDSLRQLVAKEGGGGRNACAGALESLERDLAVLARQRVLQDSTRIVSELGQEILRHYDEKAARRAAISSDPVVAQAIGILGNTGKYRELLSP